MGKKAGYVISILGIIIIGFSFKKISFGLKIIDTLNPSYIIGIGVILVVVGVILSLKSTKKLKNTDEELPIFKGTGKKRKIIGYRKD